MDVLEVVNMDVGETSEGKATIVYVKLLTNVASLAAGSHSNMTAMPFLLPLVAIKEWFKIKGEAGGSACMSIIEYSLNNSY